MSYDDFKNFYFSIVKKSCDKLKDNRFACFVVSDIRDKEGYYRNFVDYTKKCFLDNKMNFYNDIILINAIGTLPIRVKSLFKNRKVGKMHQNVLIFYKGDIKKIKDNFIDFDKKAIKI